MVEWKSVPIGAVAEIFDGPHATPKTVALGPIFLGIGALENGRINLGETRHVTPEDFQTWTRRVKPQPGDVVFSYETRIGQAAIIPSGLECCLGRRMGLVRVDTSQVDPRFFLYMYLSPGYQEFLRSRTVSGATVDRILLTDFPHFPIALPSLSEQHAIASLLGALDDKIDVNRRMNERLATTVKTLFRDLFVDFGPVKAKMLGHKPYFEPAVWSLIPDHMNEGIPAGWSKTPLDEVAHFLNGLALQKYPAVEDTYLPVIKIAQLRDGNLQSADRASLKVPSDYIIDDGDLLFSWSGSLLHRIWTNGRGALNQHLFKVSSSKVPQWFVYHWLEEHMPEFREIAQSKATTMGHIQRQHLTRAITVVADAPFMKAADSLISPLFARRITNELESRELGRMRDLLLPQLMNGEIRVRDVEKKVGELV